MRTRRTYYRRHQRTQRKKSLPIGQDKMSCSPIVESKRINNSSCLTPEILQSIKVAFNKKNPTNSIKESDPTKIWWALKTRLDCQKEDCWLDTLFDRSMKEKIKQFIFAPKHPPEWKENPTEWLTNFDIEKVMKQYEISNPEFKFIGPTTIDFDTRPESWGGRCVLEDLCNFDLARFIRAKRTKIGIVLNLDKHYQGGSHWVSLYIDIHNKIIFFFDSADNPIPLEVYKKTITPLKNSTKLPVTHLNRAPQRGADSNLHRYKSDRGGMKPLVNRIIEQGHKEGIDFKFYTNQGNQHQKTNTECGVYSLFFLITMLTGKNPYMKGVMPMTGRIRLFMKKKIPDKMMIECRKIFYNE